ncbi:MAG: lysylphosphatidylglycerol synthase transmembrane domain-containing protein [Phycisphaerae bacterium]
MSSIKTGRKRYLWHTLRFIIAAGALYLAFRKVDWPELGRLLLQLNIWVSISALGLYIASQLIFVSRWYLLLRVQSIEIGYWAAVRLHFLGLFYGNVLPSSVGGDVLRAWYVTKHTDRKVEAATSVIVDRAIGLLGLFMMAAGGYLFVPSSARQELLRQYAEMPLIQAMLMHKWLLAAIFLAVTAVGLGLILTKGGRKMVHRAVSRVSHRASVALSKIRQAVKIYYKKKLAIFVGLLLTFGCQGVFVLGLWIVGNGMGVGANVKYYFVFFPVSWLLGTIPLTPGGVGVVEWAVRVMFEGAQVTTNHASVLALAQRVLWIVGSLPGAVIHLMGAHLPKDFSIDYNKSID